MRNHTDDESSFYRNNQLNIAFIAEDSKEIRDLESRSYSDSEISSLSSIPKMVSKSKSIPGSPFLKFEPDNSLGSLEEWVKQSPHIFSKKQPKFPEFSQIAKKGAIPEPIFEMLEDDKQAENMSLCSKKRTLGAEKLKKVMTILPTTFNQYRLRSKTNSLPTITLRYTYNMEQGNENTNIQCPQSDNSQDQLRKMVEQIPDTHTNAQQEHQASHGQYGQIGNQVNGDMRMGEVKKNLPTARKNRKMLGENGELSTF